MPTDFSVERRRMFCARCGQPMFEFYRSQDGHFGIVGELQRASSAKAGVVRCPTCGARYRLLDRSDAMGRPTVRI